MIQLPPPVPGTAVDVDVDSTLPRRRRGGGVAALTAGLLVSGLLAGSQLASADTPTLGPDSSTPSDSAEPDAPSPEADTESDTGEPIADGDSPDFAEFERCVVTQLGLDPNDFTDESDNGDGEAADVELTDRPIFADNGECADLLADLPFLDVEFDEQLEAQFEAFDACLSEQLGDDFGFDLGDSAVPAGVFVDDGDGGGFYDFGEDDGSITITKIDGEVSVSTDGDVTALPFDLDAIGEGGWIGDGELTADERASLEAENAQWEAADQACAEHLPEIVGSFVDHGSIVVPGASTND